MASLKKRGKSYQIQYYVNGKQRRAGLGPIPLQIAKEKLRQFESAQLRGVDNPLPTRTPIAEVVTAYVQHIRHVKTAKSAQTDVYYLREMFGPICPALRITSRRITKATRKKPRSKNVDRRRRVQRIEAPYFEAITTRDVADFIASHARDRNLAPKTANRYREIVVRLFNWSMSQHGIHMPGDKNPAAPVERYEEPAPEISYLTFQQIDEQLTALVKYSQLRTMVAMLIYAGLRREELLWLQHRDIDPTLGPHGLIHVRAKTVNGDTWQPKTKSNRSLPISADLRRHLLEYAPRPSAGDWFFPSHQAARWDPDNFSRHLRNANRIALLPWTCLHYRHTFGSHLAQAGNSLYMISQLLGNSPEICRRHYAALSPSRLSAIVDFMRTPGDAPGRIAAQ